ncbi:hypothetical protein [Paenibacillus sp. ISL-20]|uniref:hypothetical protein n=1 Tax=Paenibacillus sp. ISL-20 TaxID=2819163 RepID=UPI001BEC5193|nr:hypothetical protein [Paenibacillus sp. ISL-20]MBT2765055.1 hypothetical protein [Paenibacillus sp. ISL-20]
MVLAVFRKYIKNSIRRKYTLVTNDSKANAPFHVSWILEWWIINTSSLRLFPGRNFMMFQSLDIGYKPFCISLWQTSRQMVSAAAINAALSFFQKNS